MPGRVVAFAASPAVARAPAAAAALRCGAFAPGAPARAAARGGRARAARMDAAPAIAETPGVDAGTHGGAAGGVFDYVVVGGGAAGCVLASRLSEDRSKSVLVLEAGGDDSDFYLHVPLGFPYLLGGRQDWAYVTQPEAALNGRRLYFPRGKVLGGSHAISVMLYHRGDAHDYDAHWPDGWHAADVLPYFRKSEGQTAAARLRDSDAHGARGPLSVSDLATVNPMTRAFLDAAVAAGLPENADFNDWTRPQDGVGAFQVTQRDGVRVSPNSAYLEPVRRRRNLTVRTGVRAERVHFEPPAATAATATAATATTAAAATATAAGPPRATAVSYVDTATGKRVTVGVRAEVLLTAGVYASPQLLMLSGVGPAAHLAGHGIPVVADAPAVGQNLQDHAAVMLSYESRDPQKDKRRSGVFYTEATGRTPGSLLNYLFRGKGPLTSPMCEAGGFVKTDPAHDSCDLQLRFIPFFSEPDPYASLADFAQGGAYLSNKSNRPAGFTLQSVVARPRSRGTVALASADVRDRVSIAANWMSDAADMATLTAGLKLSRKVAAQAPFADYRGAERYPGAAASSDADLEAYVRDSCHTANAMVGTCRMGDDAGSVVDTELRVRGVANLRVVDSSVMPTLPGGQSGAPTMMIAERAADLIKQAAAATA